MKPGDPTLASVARFSDPAAWDLILRGIPVFIPHQIKSRDGRTISVDEKRLRQIANNINKSFKSRGVPVKYQEGHTLPPTEVPQGHQPEIHAYGIGARVGKWGPGQKLGLLLDMYVLPGHLSRVRQFPFRSAEFYDDRDNITAVALLRTDPRLDMGVVFYAQDDLTVSYDQNFARVLCYSRNTMPLDPTMQDDDRLPDEEPGTGDEKEPEVDEEFDRKADQYMGRKYKHLPTMYQEFCKNMSTASGTNSLPGKDEGPEGYSRKKLPELYQKAINEVKEEVKVLKRELAQKDKAIHYSQELAALKEIGCEFDFDAELKDCLELNEDQFRRHCKRLERSAAPVGGSFVRPANMPGKQEKPRDSKGRRLPTEAESELALAYMREHKCEWDEAVKVIVKDE